jgi:SAM-dependent methyltransferase
MVDEDRERWDERYASASEDVEPTAPDGLVAVYDQVPAAGRALDVACGLGAQSLWAAERGLHVTALDVSPTATAIVTRAAERTGSADRVEVHTHDLDRGLPEGLPGPFDLIIVQRFRAPHLYPELVECLAPGGLLIVSVLSEVGHDGMPGPHHATAGELERTFVGTPLGAQLDVLASDEADGLATIVLRRRVR